MYMCLLFIFAFLIRLINLNQSLWLDEATVAKVVHSIPFFQIPFQFSIHDFHPPLYYLFMSLWGSFFGTSEIALRMPSIIFSLVAGWYVYKTAHLVGSKKNALWATCFFLFNPLIIYYSQEARMYMMATAFLTASLYYFFRNNKVLFNVFSALAMLTFYGSIFFILGMIIVYFMRTRKLFTMTWGVLLSLLLLTPLLFQQLGNARMGLSEVKNWSLVLGKAELKNLFMIFLKFATGRLSWYPKWNYYLFAGISTAIIWFFAYLGMKKNKVFSFLFFFPLCIGLLVSFVTPMMMYFRFLYLIPIMSILLASAQKGILHRFRIKYAMVALFLLFSFLYLFFPLFHREDWKGMVRDITPKKPLYMILPSSDPVSYYNASIIPYELRDMQKLFLPEHIQVIPYVEELYGYNHEEVLKKRGCMLETKSTFRGPLILENWHCPSEFIALKF